MFWKTRKDRVPQKLAAALSELAIEAYSFGGRFTMHAKLGLPTMGVTGRTEQQKVFDHEYIGIVLSWIGLALDMMDVDLKFGEGPSTEHYVQTIDDIYRMIADRIHEAICPFETKEYLHEAFSRYLPPVDDIEAAQNHIEFQLALFRNNLHRNGVTVNPRTLSVCLGDRMLNIEPKIYSLTERYRPSIAEYCRKLSDNPPSAWTAEGVERMKKLKNAQMEGRFDEAFEEMFPETASKPEESPMGGSSKQYDNPIEQVMFILGLKHDPQFETTLHAVIHGSNPGITDAADQLTAYGAIEANFHAWAKTVKMIQDTVGPTLSSEQRDELCQIIVEELDETHSGGRWFESARTPSEQWVNMASHSPVFVRGNQVFCLPGPYVRVLQPIFSSKANEE